MNPDFEIRRLMELMPASGRMVTRIWSRPEQPLVLDAPIPLPWRRQRRIYINFDLWRRIPQPQRDLLLLRSLCRLLSVRWFKPDLYQGIVIAGLLGGGVELLQGDAVGMVVGGGLSAIALQQIWKQNQESQAEIEADAEAIKLATRRGYTEPEAARNLLKAIEGVAQLENRSSLSFNELLRCQNLKTIAGVSTVGSPRT